VLKKILASVDVVRLNYSHGTADDQARRVEQVRKIAAELGRDVGILADLQGPKIRIESFKSGPVELQEGQPFALDTAWPKDAGTAEVVGCAYADLPRDVAPGDTLLLNDGAISVKVDKVEGTRISTTVQVGGTLSNRKGINRLGGGLSATALSFKDRIDIREAVALDVDFIAVSFPRNAADMFEARNLVKEAGGQAALVAKIERAEALKELPEIIGASDAVMVARGDLGVEIGDAELPGWQKKIINQAREQNRMVITATQMMESMITSPIPTRAEVLDVANAVMDGTDAVMLSAETASGKYPIKVVEAMVRVCEGAERAAPSSERLRLEGHFERTDEAIAMATTWTARNMRASAIIALTESGSTPLLMSRTDTRIPIYAMTRHERTRRRMGLVRGVYPIQFSPTSITAPIREAVAALVERKLLKEGDRVLLTKGDFSGPGGTNEMKIIKVGETG
jgi:pyruvate kinase